MPHRPLRRVFQQQSYGKIDEEWVATGWLIQQERGILPSQMAIEHIQPTWGFIMDLISKHGDNSTMALSEKHGNTRKFPRLREAFYSYCHIRGYPLCRLEHNNPDIPAKPTRTPAKQTRSGTDTVPLFHHVRVRVMTDKTWARNWGRFSWIFAAFFLTMVETSCIGICSKLPVSEWSSVVAVKSRHFRLKTWIGVDDRHFLWAATREFQLGIPAMEWHPKYGKWL